jgi:hypothetical protein
VQVKVEIGGAKGIAKNVIEGEVQFCQAIRVSAAMRGRSVTRKHHGATSLRVGGMMARGAPTDS